MNFRSRSIAPPTSSLCAMSPSALERSTMSWTSRSIRAAPVSPSSSISSAGRSPSEMIPARTASSMSWLMYATRSTIRTTRPSSVAGFPGPGVVEDPVPHLLGQVEPPAVARQHLHHPQRVLVVPEAHPVLPQRLVEHLLADVAEGRMPEVVTQPDRLGQVLVQPQRPARRSAR